MRLPKRFKISKNSQRRLHKAARKAGYVLLVVVLAIELTVITAFLAFKLANGTIALADDAKDNYNALTHKGWCARNGEATITYTFYLPNGKQVTVNEDIPVTIVNPDEKGQMFRFKSSSRDGEGRLFAGRWMETEGFYDSGSNRGVMTFFVVRDSGLFDITQTRTVTFAAAVTALTAVRDDRLWFNEPCPVLSR